MEKILFEKRFSGKQSGFDGSGIHTRNGDTIALSFILTKGNRGVLQFGFSGGMEASAVRLDFKEKWATLETTDWTVRQPAASVRLRLKKLRTHTLVLEKREGLGNLVRMADITAVLDGQILFVKRNVNVLPEIGVMVKSSGPEVVLKRLVHRGKPSTIPEYLRVGAYQVINRPNIATNLKSFQRGIREAAAKKVRLLLTPETGLTGLFPTHRVTKAPGPIAEAEKKLRSFLRRTKNAPWVTVGLPIWRAGIRYNAMRLYDPDGMVCGTYPKIHSCEYDLMHGYRLAEFDIEGVPVTMHVCHDARYPDVYTLPVMFGARLVLHPANGGKVSGKVETFLGSIGRPSAFSNTFYVHSNGGGGSYIVGCKKFDNTIAVSEESRRNAPAYPDIGEPVECLIQSRLRIHDAYGYWPTRSFRISEEVAASYYTLYKAMGGSRC